LGIIPALRVSVLHVTFYVQFTSIFNCYVIDVRLSCLLLTSVSETIRKQPLVKAQTALTKQKINKISRKTILNMADGILTPCNVACGSGIVTVNSPSGSTLQCDTWLWDDMSLPLNSPDGSTLQ